MIKLLSIEMKKILPYKTFWILLGLYFVFLGLGIMMAEFIINNWVDRVNSHIPLPLPHVTLYFFPDIWQNITFFASIRHILIFPAIIIIILITNEFTNKTIRQNIVNGMSRHEFLLSKLQIIFLMAVLITFLLAAGIFILGVLHSDAASMRLLWVKFSFIPGFFIQVFTFMIFAFFTGFLMQNTGLTISIFTLYALIIEPVLYFFLKIPRFHLPNISQYLPVNSVIRIVEYPNIQALKHIMGFTILSSPSLTECAVPLIYSVVMIAVVYFLMMKKDL
jgi:hypothetical protein